MDGIAIKHVRVMRRFKTFDLVLEEWSHGDESPLVVEAYRTRSGDWIDNRQGRKKKRRPGIVKAIARLEISAEKNKPEHCVCSIGHSAVDGKWYGWSHRAMVGFGVGDRIFHEAYGLCAACASSPEGRDPCAEYPDGVDDPVCPLYGDDEDAWGCKQRSNMVFTSRGAQTITTDAQAREAAAAFAAYVS